MRYNVLWVTAQNAGVGSLFCIQAKEARYLTQTATKALLHPLQLHHVHLPFLLHLLQLLHHLVFLPYGILQLWNQQLGKVLRLLCLVDQTFGLQ